MLTKNALRTNASLGENTWSMLREVEENSFMKEC